MLLSGRACFREPFRRGGSIIRGAAPQAARGWQDLRLGVVWFSSSGQTPMAVYRAKLQSGELREDARQMESMQLFERLYQELEEKREVMAGSRETILKGLKQERARQKAGLGSTELKSGEGGGGGGFLGTLFGGSKSSGDGATTSGSVLSAGFKSSVDVPKGLYLWGGVGCGKTFMMDIFYRSVKETIPEIICKRTHYHTFMLDIHKRLHERRQQAKLEKREEQDPLPKIAAEIVAHEAQLLCLDEFQVTDVADAMILKHLFESLFRRNCILVATSNREPDALYHNGINRQSFLPFLDVLRQYCDVHFMAHGQDHRLLGTLNEGVYHTPHDSPETKATMGQVFQRLAGESGKPAKIPVMMGRQLDVPRASDQSGGVAQFTFSDLCEEALGAADYIAIASKYANVILTDIPGMKFTEREKIRRFITLLDVLYENRCQLICSAEKPPAELFGDGETAKEGDFQVDEAFASSRAVSRLIEMQSEEYIRRSGQQRKLE